MNKPLTGAGFQNFRLEGGPSSPAVNTATSQAQLQQQLHQHQSSNQTRQNVPSVHSVPQQVIQVKKQLKSLINSYIL